MKKHLLCAVLSISLLISGTSISQVASAKETFDRFSSDQWAYYNAISNINVEKAWELGKGKDKEVIVAVVDTGIDYQHVDLSKSIWLNTDEVYQSEKDHDKNGYSGDYYGWNFVDDSPIICDYYYLSKEMRYSDYHGTHVAGIIAATANNGVGVAGVASSSNVKVMSVKVIDAQGNGKISSIIKGIQYAQDNGASICNLSIGIEEFNNALYKVMKDSPMLFVCAAGNGDIWTKYAGYDIGVKPVYPAAFNLDNVIAVGNTNSTGELDSSSCYSSELVDIAAPGTEIISTNVDEKHSSEGAYFKATGTSMAAPFVSSTAAMIASYYGELSSSEIKKMILMGSTSKSVLLPKIAEGRFLDVYGALTYDGLMASVETSIENIPYTNNKNYNIRVHNPFEEELTLYYAKGKQSLSYFSEHGNYETLELKNNSASISVKKTVDYTIYLKDSSGNEEIYYNKIVVPKLSKLKINASKKTLKTGDEFRLKSTLEPSGVYADVRYESSNPKVAAVSSAGKVVAKKNGKAVITITAKDGSVTKKMKCTLTVKN